MTFCSTGNFLQGTLSIFSLGTEALGSLPQKVFVFSINIQKTGYRNNH